jgi:acetylornithine deacetylase/succinyl-diaminopimelate desuccinylase-like protein
MHFEIGPFNYIRANAWNFVAELQDFIRFPSISAQPRRAGDVKACAQWLANHLRGTGLRQAKVIRTSRYPIVYADWLEAPDHHTVLIYGHYDVQPPDLLEVWKTPPFEPIIQGNDLYGRGVSDDKGQMFVHVKALESYLHTNGRLPVNVKCLFEGEEEIGSPHLAAALERHKDALAADVAVLSDTRMLAPDRPVMTESLRGALSVELEVRGPAHDLHSGNFGGAVHNPLQALCEIIANLHDRNGRATIPGFYDPVRQWSDPERTYMAQVGPSNATLLQDAHAAPGWGERG